MTECPRKCQLSQYSPADDRLRAPVLSAVSASVQQIPQVESSPPSTLQGNTLTRADYRIDRNGAGGVRVISKTQRALLTPGEIWRRVEAYRAGTEQITARHGHCPS
ncbi:hypothetical protein FQA47_009418 [Oryzias melastigma]|uniref:Uncharacterized protein n=1 Tax=Oryzias melastigma TaxID=30732 RepID=A0A834CI25_ORYME|nr:hypothetical protein FQA47_009418 [Oryzias melastigma]